MVWSSVCNMLLRALCKKKKKELLTTIWNYTRNEVIFHKKQICPDFFPEEPAPHLVQFLSCKWPPPIRAHQVFTFWVRSLTGRLTVILYLYLHLAKILHAPTYLQGTFSSHGLALNSLALCTFQYNNLPTCPNSKYDYTQLHCQQEATQKQP